jgi:phosphoribosylformylglycinamidine synthase
VGEVHALVVTGYGTNCHMETAHAIRLAGADRCDTAHFSELISTRARLAEYNFLIFPGGFLDGDDLGAAQAAAMRWRYMEDKNGTPLLTHLEHFLEEGKLVLGICNGFQLLVKLGVLPGIDGGRFERRVSLGHNDSARFEDRWVYMAADPESPCVFTRGLDILTMPVRHGEGKIFPDTAELLGRLEEKKLIPLRYVDPASLEPTLEYPANPNGSPLAAAGICDPSGRVLGLMPHPEAFHHVTNHPGWTRGEVNAPGTMIFVNAVRYLRKL